jgi:glycosyltransferase involved in cell wall biosynthesis
MYSCKVSICLITYNHEKYIRQTIESILAQETDFDVEIVVGQDLCNDNTPEIVNTFLENNDNIRVLTTDKRLGMIPNWIRTLKACKGEFIAIIEGDDYWRSMNKLSVQAHFLCTNPDFSLCFHRIETQFDRDHNQEDYLTKTYGGTVFSIRDIINKNWFIGTCSMMIRTDDLPDFKPWVYRQKAIDKTIQLQIAKKGKIKYFDDIVGVYRIHDQGISQQQWLGKENTYHLSLINILKGFDSETNHLFASPIDARIIKLYKNMLAVNYDHISTYVKLYILLALYKPFSTMGIKRWMMIEYFPLQSANLKRLFRKNNAV